MNRTIGILLVSTALSLAACGRTFTAPAATAAPTQPATATLAAPATAPPAPAGPIKHIVIIVMENENLGNVLKNPYFAGLAGRGALLKNFRALTHPSQPNYIAMISGELYVRDNNRHDLPQTNLVDLLEAAHVSWKAYQEDYPGACAAGMTYGNYVRKHNPFISFDTIRKNPERCARIVNAAQLAIDVANDDLPAFSFYTPDMNNDGHDTPLKFAADWLKGFLEPLLADPKFAKDTLVVITFDEGTVIGSNIIYTALLGPMVNPGHTDTARYTHYSLLRTIEDTFNLGTLGRNDAKAAPFAAENFK